MDARRSYLLGLVVGAVVVASVAVLARSGGDDRAIAGDTTSTTSAPAPSTMPPVAVVTTSATTTTTTTLPERPDGSVPAWTVGSPWGSVEGITMFRGSPTRTYYGEGPVPQDPAVVWRYPDTAMCGDSTFGGAPRTWCGTGWTGQPLVWERPDGVTEIIFGSYDKSVHFLDAATGEPTRPRFVVGDIVKGSPTLDPDGYPLLYFGARDNQLRIVALDRDEPTELWSRDAYEDRVVWNDDWDSNPAIVDDILYEGGENGWFYAFALDRGYDADGMVTVDPEPLLVFPVFTDELMATIGREQSVENSVVVLDDRVFFANSAGRVVGLDVSNIQAGEAPVVFDFWAGEDVDATLVADTDGMLYMAAEVERFNDRGEQVGQLVKLDPTSPDDPIVWSVSVPPRAGGDGGLWATPALGDGVLYAATHPGELLAVDTETGEVVWRDEIGFHAWSSPTLVDGTLVAAVDCTEGGALRGYDVSDPRTPRQVWEVATGSGCIESSPIVWRGRIYVGSRDGYFYAFGDR